MSILKQAYKKIHGPRQREYGNPSDNLKRTARIASHLTGKNLDASDVVKVMMAIKLSREAHKHKTDNLVDLCGYADILQQIQGK